MTDTSPLASTHDAGPPIPAPDEGYEDFLTALRTPPAAAPLAAGDRLFTTDVPEGLLWQLFLAEIPADRRQHYTCRACQRFVDRFGGLVTIAADGQAHPAFWDDSPAVPAFFRGATKRMAQAVRRARVTGVFVSSERTWGMPSNGSKKPPFEWHHMAVTPPLNLVHKSVLQSADQLAAVKLEEHGMLCRGLAEFPIEFVREAHTLLSSGNLYRSEKCIGAARWLLELHVARSATMREDERANLVWRAVATAPAGFCHVRSGMIGTLIEDIQAGLPFADIKRKFDAKMSPIAYQRPQAPPTAGAIAQAEGIVGKLKTAGSLLRRFAKVADVEALWKPAPPAPPPATGEGVFAHLKPKGTGEVPKRTTQPAVTITWVKFHATVLPDAERIELLVPDGRGPFTALITAVNPDAPPILQWDREDRRNPVSWYFYHEGSPASKWGLRARSWVDVTAITYQPSMWGDPDALKHQGKGAFFLLEGARDLQPPPGGGFFVESLKSEYHSVRSVLEAYAASAGVAGAEEATACGIGLQAAAKGDWNVTVRVTSKGGAQILYTLDRWD